MECRRIFRFSEIHQWSSLWSRQSTESLHRNSNLNLWRSFLTLMCPSPEVTEKSTSENAHENRFARQIFLNSPFLPREFWMKSCSPHFLLPEKIQDSTLSRWNRISIPPKNSCRKNRKQDATTESDAKKSGSALAMLGIFLFLWLPKVGAHSLDKIN